MSVSCLYGYVMVQSKFSMLHLCSTNMTPIQGQHSLLYPPNRLTYQRIRLFDNNNNNKIFFKSNCQMDDATTTITMIVIITIIMIFIITIIIIIMWKILSQWIEKYFCTNHCFPCLRMEGSGILWLLCRWNCQTNYFKAEKYNVRSIYLDEK